MLPAPGVRPGRIRSVITSAPAGTAAIQTASMRGIPCVEGHVPAPRRREADQPRDIWSVGPAWHADRDEVSAARRRLAQGVGPRAGARPQLPVAET